MKYITLVLLLLPSLLVAQSITIQGAAQIDAREVVIGQYPGEDELLLFVNHDSDLTVEDSTFTNVGGYDINIGLLEDGYLDYGLTLATPGSEKWHSFGVLNDGTDSAYYVAQFQDSLKIQFEDDDDDSDVWRSDFPYAVGVMMSDENDILWRSYIGYADTSIIKSTPNKGHLYLAGKFSDSLQYVDPTGFISEFSLPGTDEGIFLMSIDAEGDLDWMVTFDGDDFANVANLTMIGDDVSLLYNNIEGSSMITINPAGDLVRQVKWDNCTFIHSAFEYGSLYISGSVDTDEDHNLELNSGVFSLPAGNDNDGALISYNADFSFNWVKNIAGANRSHIANFDFTSDGFLYATGHIRGESTIGDGIVLTGAEDDHDLFIAKYAVDGTPVWAEVYQSEGDDSGRYIIVADEESEENQVHVVGTFAGELTLPIDFFEETFIADTNLSPRSWVAMTFEEDLSSSTTDVPAGRLQLSPNPATNYLLVANQGNDSAYILTDVSGKEQVLNSRGNHIDISALMPGVYALRSVGDTYGHATRFVKL